MDESAVLAIIAAIIRECNGGVDIKEALIQAKDYLQEARSSFVWPPNS